MVSDAHIVVICPSYESSMCVGKVILIEIFLKDKQLSFSGIIIIIVNYIFCNIWKIVLNIDRECNFNQRSWSSLTNNYCYSLVM